MGTGAHRDCPANYYNVLVDSDSTNERFSVYSTGRTHTCTDSDIRKHISERQRRSNTAVQR